MTTETTTTLSPMLAGAVALATQHVETANAAATRVINADNATALLHQVRDEIETTDENILKYRAAMDQIELKRLEFQSQIEKYITDNGLVDTEPVDVEAEKAAYREAKTQYDALKGMFKLLTNEDLPVSVELVKLPGTRAGGTGSTTLRPRVSAVKVDGTLIQGKGPKDKNTKEDTFVSNFSVLAAHLSKVTDRKVEVSDLHTHAFEAAGTKDLSSLNGKPFSFVYNVEMNDAENTVHTFNIEITPSVKG